MFPINILHNIHFRQTFIPLILALLVISCNDDFVSPTSDGSEGVERIVSLRLRSEGFSGDESYTTRAINNGLVEEDSIKDYWLIQYDNTGNRIGFPRYYEYNGDNPDVRIIVPTDPSHVFKGVILVNTHNKDLFDEENDMSMSEDHLKTMYDEIRQEEEVYTTYEESDGKISHYLPMSCVFDIPAPKNGEIQEFNCILRRNVAKMIMRLNTTGVKINNVLWRNVPEKRYIAEQLNNPRGLTETSFQEAYRNAMEPDVKVLDWDQEDITDEQNKLAAVNNGYLELVYYLPRSCWGKAGDATQAKDKNWDAPDKATYFEIQASKTDGSGDLRYRIYPGINVTTDFNIIANCCYTISVALKTSDIANDSRVEDMNRIRLAESNSYIIDPGKPITYEIPISRINEFWSNDKVETNASANVLKDSDEWIAEVIWQDQAQQMIQFSTADSDAGLTSYIGTGSTSFYVRPVNKVAGNVVIGVRRKPADGTADPAPKDRLYLWSWHLWITNYNPDEQSHAWVEGQYEYEVTGGKVHRYESSYWQTTFHNKYMMDRNLGALTSDPGTDNANLLDTFGMYYQYGRHAPIPYPELKNVYDVNGVSISAFAYNSGKYNMLRQLFAKSHAEAVTKPHTFFYCSSIKVPPLYYTLRRWLGDNNLTIYNLYERNVWDNPDWYSDTKSIFDPCPPGWEVPDYGVYEGFASYEVSYLDATAVKSYFKTNSVESNNTKSGNDGVIKGYHLYLNPDDISKGTAWFPLTGCKSSTNASHYVGPTGNHNSGPEGMYWMSVPINSDYCNRMDMTRAGIQLTPSFDRGSRSAACPVRCIRQ